LPSEPTEAVEVVFIAVRCLSLPEIIEYEIDLARIARTPKMKIAVVIIHLASV
jgi:transcription antitermination factor NusA-like protein